VQEQANLLKKLLKHPKVDMVDDVPAYKKSLIDTNITILALQKKK
jgi:IS1 family transposase